MDEPVLNVSNIQGNIIPGFNKDYQALLFLKIERGKESDFRDWLKELTPRVTTMGQVLAFRSLLTEEERRSQPPKVKTTWINIAFSHDALGKLGAVAKNRDFTDKAFKEGLTKDRANNVLGDPEGENEGNPEKWVVGGPKNGADVILIVASDDRLDLVDEVARIGKRIYDSPVQKGIEVIFTQYGANLPGRREHFGFRDGVSQPGVRGQISDNFGGYLTPRYEDESQGNPGLDLVWPGEFVFGTKYLKQRSDHVTEAGPPSLAENDGADPAWAEDGSFLVFRRLRQDVGAFHAFLRDTAANPALLAAKCVGRWPSGTPILHDSEGKEEQAAIAQDKLINNDFTFTEDPKGERCPFVAHIRKVYPRDGNSEAQTHRLLRRGIPYGEPSWSSLTAPYRDTIDRGLLFLAYQTSIENQFEFLQKQANGPKDKGVEYDPIIGQNTKQGTRERQFTVTYIDNHGTEQKAASSKEDWVIPTGGGYFFAPSIEALQILVETSQNIRAAYFSGRPIEARGMSANRRGPAKLKAITPDNWARIWAHAWVKEKEGDKEFRKKLKTNPREAVKDFQDQAGSEFPKLNPYEKFFDLAGDIYKKPFDRGSFKGMSFSGMSPNDLKEIAEKGTLHGKPFCVQPSEWIIVRAKK